MQSEHTTSTGEGASPSRRDRASVAAGTAATPPAATCEHGGSDDRHARLSLQPSPDIAFALSALRFFRDLENEQFEVIDQWEREARKGGRFFGDLDGWKAWTRGTEHGFECKQTDAIADMQEAIELFIRRRKCRTVGDLVAKVQLNAFWMKETASDGTALYEHAEDYAEEAFILVRSILPLIEALDAGKEAVT